MFSKTYFMLHKSKKSHLLLFYVFLVILNLFLDFILMVIFGNDIEPLLRLFSIILCIVLLVLYIKKNRDYPKGYYVNKIMITDNNIQLFFNNNNCISESLDKLQSAFLSYGFLDIKFIDMSSPVRVNIDYFKKVEMLNDLKQVIMNNPNKSIKLNF